MSDMLEVVNTEWYDAELAAMPAEYAARVIKRVDVLRQKPWGAALADRTVAPLRDGIYELRILGRGAAFRVLFFLAPGRSPRLVVLTTCVAKSAMKKRKLLDAELERAAARREMWIEQEKRRRANERG
jgi:hypothetical protein